MRRMLFGDAGYGLDAGGFGGSVAALQIADLKTIIKNLSLPNNCVLAIYGDVKAGELKSGGEVFGKWKRGEKVQNPKSKVQSPKSNRVVETGTRSRR